jgi:hypothetical protein
MKCTIKFGIMRHGNGKVEGREVRCFTYRNPLTGNIHLCETGITFRRMPTMTICYTYEGNLYVLRELAERRRVDRGVVVKVIHDGRILAVPEKSLMYDRGEMMDKSIPEGVQIGTHKWRYSNEHGKVMLYRDNKHSSKHIMAKCKSYG